MNRSLKNTLSVAVVTAMTALAIFSAVQVTGRIVSLPTSGAVSATTAAATGGTALAASTGASPNSALTCPATGCTATSCHATTGRRP